MTSSFEQRLCCMLATTADCWKGSKETRTLRLIGPCSAATSLYQSPEPLWLSLQALQIEPAQLEVGSWKL
jgi:hypothetical protein